MSIPVSDEVLQADYRCAPWTAGQGFDPIGSATEFGRLVTVEMALPWLPAIEDMEWIASVDRPKGTRLQAIVPEVGRNDGTVLLTRWERHGATFEGIDWLVPAIDVPEALGVLVSGADPKEHDLGDSVTEAPREVLICSHGARDRCCGGPGTRLAVEVRAALPDIRIRRTSHLGGHRYAPTSLSLPDGRMWAYLDADALVGIVRRTIPAPEARDFYRGNVALDGWAQTLEGDVLVEGGWDAVDFEELSAVSSVDGDRATVTLQWCSANVIDERTGTVEIVQRYPVLQCGLAPAEAKKTAPEYRVV